MLMNKELLDRVSIVSESLDGMSEGKSKDTLSEQFELAVTTIYAHLACFDKELTFVEAGITAACHPLVDPAVFYQRAKEMYNDSKNLPEHWKVTKPDELTACLDDIRSLCVGKTATRQEMQALAERFAELIPANYGMLVNMHLQ